MEMRLAPILLLTISIDQDLSHAVYVLLHRYSAVPAIMPSGGQVFLCP